MKNSSGFLFSVLLSIGLVSSCVSGDTTNGSGASGTGNSSGSGTGNSSGSGTGNTTGSGTGNATGSGTGNTTGSGTGNATGSGTGNTTGSGTGNTTGSGTGNTTGSGTGNTTGSGTGNTSGTGNSSGAGNGSGTCISGTTVMPTGALITDFSDAMPSTTSPGDFTFGTMAGMLGGTSRFASPASTPGTLSLVGGALSFTGTVGAMTTTDMYPYNGFVVYVNGPSCLNATSYAGVSFSLTVTGNCVAVFSFGDADHTTAASDPNRGLCIPSPTNGCYASQFNVMTGTTGVTFSSTPSLVGMPTGTVDTGKFTGVQWQLKAMTNTASCTGTVTVDNIKFM